MVRPVAPLLLLLVVPPPQAARTLPPTPNAAPATPATLRKSRRVTGVLPIPAPSDASLDLRSSELMPPACFGSAVTGDSTASRTDQREPPLGPCWIPGRCAPPCARKARADDEDSPARSDPVSMAPLHLRCYPPYGHSLPRYGHHIAAGIAVKLRTQPNGLASGHVRAALEGRPQAQAEPTSSGDSLSRSMTSATVAGSSCSERAILTRRSTSWALDVAGTPFSRVSVTSMPVRALPPMARPMVVIGRLALATPMTCQLVPAGSSRTR